MTSAASRDLAAFLLAPETNGWIARAAELERRLLDTRALLSGADVQGALEIVAASASAAGERAALAFYTSTAWSVPAWNAAHAEALVRALADRSGVLWTQRPMVAHAALRRLLGWGWLLDPAQFRTGFADPPEDPLRARGLMVGDLLAGVLAEPDMVGAHGMGLVAAWSGALGRAALPPPGGGAPAADLSASAAAVRRRDERARVVWSALWLHPDLGAAQGVLYVAWLAFVAQATEREPHTGGLDGARAALAYAGMMLTDQGAAALVDADGRVRDGLDEAARAAAEAVVLRRSVEVRSDGGVPNSNGLGSVPHSAVHHRM